jgi:hypothetical protein
MLSLPWLAAVMIAAALLVAGAGAHSAWLRRRTRVIRTDGEYLLVVGRAVAGVWSSRGRALWHLRGVRAQMAGRITGGDPTWHER